MNLLKSSYSKIFLFFAILSLIITLLKYKSFVSLFSQILIYYFILKQLNCNLYGNCHFAALITIIVPIITIIIVILDYLQNF